MATTREYRITMIEEDESPSWWKFVQRESWGSTEPHWVEDGSQVAKNYAEVTVLESDVERFERALERDKRVLTYCEIE